MKKWAVVLFFSTVAFAQTNFRYDAPIISINSQAAQQFLVANVPPSAPVLAVCKSPANAVPCTNYATTFNGLGFACSVGAQDTPQPATTSSCQSTGDAQGNIGFWAPAGTYDYTICIGITCLGPYTVTLNGTTSLLVSNYVTNFAGSPTTSGTLGNTMGGGTTGGVGSQSNVTNYPTNANPEWSLSHGQGGACTTACIGDMCCQTANNSAIHLLTIQRFDAKVGVSNTAVNTRFWVGLTVFNVGSTLGNNSSNPQNSGVMLADIPNKTTIAFRFSNPAGDTVWKAVLIQAGASATSNIIATTVVADGTLTFPQPPHVFSIIPSVPLNTVTWFIDGKQVASACLSCTINLNPTAPNDIMFTPFYLGDNNNHPTSVVSTMWYYNVLYNP